MSTQGNTSGAKQALNDRPLPKRRQVAVKLGERLAGNLTEAERDVAWGIARQLVEDTSQMVREELAVSLCNRPDLPKDLAQQLARDADQVSSAFLAKTPVFTDDELCELVRIVSDKVRRAIASRPVLEARLANLLAELGDSEVASVLISNKGAQLGISGYKAIIERFTAEPSLLEKMAMRSELPPDIVSELVDLVSDATRIFLEETYEVSSDIAKRVTEQTESAVLLRLVDRHNNEDAEALLKVLFNKGQLSRTLCLLIARRSNIYAFSAAISLLTDIPTQNIETVLRKGAANAIGQVCQRANLPQFAQKEIVQHMMAARSPDSTSDNTDGKVA